MVARPYQLVWLLGAIVFCLAVYSTTQAGTANQWVEKVMPQKPQAPEVAASKQTYFGRPSLEEHMRLAEKSWAKGVKQRHETLKEWPSTDAMPFFAAYDSKSYFTTPYSIWDFTTASWSCPWEMERIGRLGDGGKWVCGMSLYEAIPKERPCIIYSFGVQFESTYEDETIERTHCEIWAYDFSVTDFGKQLSPEHKLRAHFTKAGIAGKTDPAQDPPFYSIQDLMKLNGHDYIDIMKMDIEFSEFESLTSLSEAFPESEGKEFPIGQLLVEIHIFGYKGEMTPSYYLKWWEMLESRGMRPAWTEPNLLYTTLRLEKGDPRLAEYSFINIKDSRSVLFGEYHAQKAKAKQVGAA